MKIMTIKNKNKILKINKKKEKMICELIIEFIIIKLKLSYYIILHKQEIISFLSKIKKFMISIYFLLIQIFVLELYI
jgi:hypothetical protein